MNRIERMLLAVACLIFVACGSKSQPTSPVIQISQTSLSFGASQGIALNPAAASVSVTNAGGGALTFTAASDSPWLAVTPGNGTAPQSVSVSATVGALTANTYTGHITITATGAQGSPTTIPVKFVVAGAPSNAPFWSQWGADRSTRGW